jgi:hypothetical protein
MKFLQFFILIIKKFLVIKNDNLESLDNPSEMGEDLFLHFLLSLLLRILCLVIYLVRYSMSTRFTFP